MPDSARQSARGGCKEHDTTSILATIEHRYGLAPLSTRDAAVNDLSSVWSGKVVKR